MRVLLAEHAGFCFGVKNAIETVMHAADNGSVCTFGELIHNRRTVDNLAKRGIFSVSDLSQVSTQQIVIRSHGASPEVYRELGKLPVRVVDATCPFVRRIHEKAKQLHEQGLFTVVIGQKDHPEILATMGWAGENAKLIDSVDEAKGLSWYDRISVIGQTTYSMQKCDLILNELKKHTDHLDVFDFVCATTSLRQRETMLLTEKCDVVLVVGDQASANTRKLYEIASQTKTAYLISGADDPILNGLKPECVCGITGGASAPPEALQEIIDKLTKLYSCTFETIAT